MRKLLICAMVSIPYLNSQKYIYMNTTKHVLTIESLNISEDSRRGTRGLRHAVDAARAEFDPAFVRSVSLSGSPLRYVVIRSQL